MSTDLPSQDAPDTFSGHVTVDAIEGGLARIELPNGVTQDWPLASLPSGVREGDVVRLHVNGGDLEIEIDRAETRRRQHQAQQQLDALNAGDQGGDLAL